MMEAKSVLIVDDEPMIRESVSAYITKKGYHVFTAENGRITKQISDGDYGARLDA